MDNNHKLIILLGRKFMSRKLLKFHLSPKLPAQKTSTDYFQKVKSFFSKWIPFLNCGKHDARISSDTIQGIDDI